MSPEFLARIFEPFTQESPGARSSYEGTGLGMSIAKKLVDAMGGTIEVSSRVGGGLDLPDHDPVRGRAGARRRGRGGRASLCGRRRWERRACRKEARPAAG